MFSKVNPRDIVKKLLNMAGGKVPVFGSVVNIVINDVIFPEFLDGWIFPKPQKFNAKLFKEQLELVMDKKIEFAVGVNTLNKIKNHLRGLIIAFQNYAQVVNPQERNIKRAYLQTLVDATLSDIETVGDKYLHKLTDPLQLVAILHIAVLIEEVKVHPEHYENQVALNKTAIRYSELAGRIRDRFLWYRLGQIAEGRGALYEADVDARQLIGKPAEKKVRFMAYDDFRYWDRNDNYRSEFLNNFVTDWVNANTTDSKYLDKKEEAQRKIAEYGEQEKKMVYDWWDKHLTKTTAEFMNFVDWPGEQGKRKPKDRMLVQAFPIQMPKAISEHLSVVERIDLFLRQQMDQFATSGPRYVQTYRLPGATKFGDENNMFYRADTYDTAIATIYFSLRGDIQRACDLADGLCTALEHDPIGGGRIVAATHATSLIDKNMYYSTSIFYPEGTTRDIGNMCWAGIALTRMYAETKRHHYLYNALVIGHWILQNCSVDDSWKGFSGGEDAWEKKRKWRSVEHNVDAYSFFLNLYELTKDKTWQNAANSAKTLVIACLTKEGYYITGTGEKQDLNSSVVPTDTQSWTALSNLNPAGNAQSLQFMLDKQTTITENYKGFKFALAGSDVQNEVTAGAVMALYLQGGKFRDVSQVYFDSLEAQQKNASNTDGLGLVATPGKEADTGAGLGWKYFNWLHVASSAWTGLAFLAREDTYANPYELVRQK